MKNNFSETDDRPKNQRKKKIYAILLILMILLGGVAYLVFTSEWYITQVNTNPGPFKRINFVPENKAVSNGNLTRTPEGLVIMNLEGTYAEMGYAHGLLLGEYIKYSVEYMLLLTKTPKVYAEAHAVIEEYAVINETYHESEIHNIFQAAVDSKVDRFVPGLKREWDETDLWMLNSIQDWYQIFCSGTGVWGSSSATGKTILSRTLDFGIDRNAFLIQMNLIAHYHGDSTRNDVIAFTFPGIIGVMSGFNNYGIWMHLDSSNGVFTTELNRTQIAISMRNFLEKENGTDITNRAQAHILNENLAAPVLLLVGCNEPIESPVFVLECRDDMVGVRGEAKPGDDFVVLTNHERVNKEPEECYRYQTYLNDFQEYLTSGDTKIDADEILISQQHTGSWGSLLVVQFYPHNLTFRVGYSHIDPAFKEGRIWNSDNIIGGPWDPLLNKWFAYPGFNKIA